ncbi:MAG TPA: hypothetical protein PLX89_06180 [Verrucomicrobiota bacterium]|nr:hypothetical protein [Verrucomicrobiales bacterium]HRI12578.1 hypothetical protein [Verrucomicrobiota bacterium]
MSTSADARELESLLSAEPQAVAAHTQLLALEGAPACGTRDVGGTARDAPNRSRASTSLGDSQAQRRLPEVSPPAIRLLPAATRYLEPAQEPP